MTREQYHRLQTLEQHCDKIKGLDFSVGTEVELMALEMSIAELQAEFQIEVQRLAREYFGIYVRTGGLRIMEQQDPIAMYPGEVIPFSSGKGIRVTPVYSAHPIEMVHNVRDKMVEVAERMVRERFE